LNRNAKDILATVQGGGSISFIEGGNANLRWADCLPEHFPASEPVVATTGFVDIKPDTYGWHFRNHRIVSFLPFVPERRELSGGEITTIPSFRRTPAVFCELAYDSLALHLLLILR
jgi:hypothetical protein